MIVSTQSFSVIVRSPSRKALKAPLETLNVGGGKLCYSFFGCQDGTGDHTYEHSVNLLAQNFGRVASAGQYITQASMPKFHLRPIQDNRLTCHQSGATWTNIYSPLSFRGKPNGRS